eukprot:537231_1
MYEMYLGHKIQKLKLNLYKHNGHSYAYTPCNLLDGSTNTYYQSKRGVTTGDWITFKMNSPSHIRKINITSRSTSDGIKCISLFVSSDKSLKQKYYKLSNINNIHPSKKK